MAHEYYETDAVAGGADKVVNEDINHRNFLLHLQHLQFRNPSIQVMLMVQEVCMICV